LVDNLSEQLYFILNFTKCNTGLTLFTFARFFRKLGGAGRSLRVHRILLKPDSGRKRSNSFHFQTELGKMNSRDQKYFKRRLNEWLKVLLHQSNITISGMQNYAERPIEIVDQAVMENERALALRIRTREKFLIQKILQSLQDIDTGEYGVCDVCGDRIGVKRLKVRPVTRHCIRCKMEMEKRERLIGD
jgi:DnaK suppressor protein